MSIETDVKTNIESRVDDWHFGGVVGLETGDKAKLLQPINAWRYYPEDITFIGILKRKPWRTHDKTIPAGSIGQVVDRYGWIGHFYYRVKFGNDLIVKEIRDDLLAPLQQGD